MCQWITSHTLLCLCVYSCSDMSFLHPYRRWIVISVSTLQNLHLSDWLSPTILLKSFHIVSLVLGIYCDFFFLLAIPVELISSSPFQWTFLFIPNLSNFFLLLFYCPFVFLPTWDFQNDIQYPTTECSALIRRNPRKHWHSGLHKVWCVSDINIVNGS